MKYNNGTRVRIGGDLSSWTRMAQENLPGVCGVVMDYKADYDGYPAYLVNLDSPVQVNPISTFDQAWINEDNLSRCCWS